jgi:hypothetical protein
MLQVVEIFLEVFCLFGFVGFLASTTDYMVSNCQLHMSIFLSRLSICLDFKSSCSLWYNIVLFFLAGRVAEAVNLIDFLSSQLDDASKLSL